MKKILIIDDVVDFGFLVKENLESVGDYEVICAGTGEEGLKIAEKDPPALILLDVNMPQMDGFEVVKKLKDGKKTSSIPIIMLTAIKYGDPRLKALRTHTDGHIVKPFTMRELEAKVSAILSRPGK